MQGNAAVSYDPLNAVLVELALVKQLAAGPHRQKFAWLVAVVFVFDDVCYVFDHKNIVAHALLFVKYSIVGTVYR